MSTMQPLSYCLLVSLFHMSVASYFQDTKRNWSIYYDMEWKPVPVISETAAFSSLKEHKLRFGPLPCSCQESTCGCCVNINMNFWNFSRTGCMNFTYVANDFAVQMNLLMNDESVYTNSLSGKNPPPACIPFPYIPSLEFCVKIFDIYTEGRNIHMCVDFETRIVREPILVLQFDCVMIGTDGLSHLKPSESSVTAEEQEKMRGKSLCAPLKEMI